jgi:hypothetical protein
MVVKPPNAGDGLPVLINLSARLRMLSHRICLLLMLVEAPAEQGGDANAGHRQLLAGAMAEFEKIYAAIVDGNAELGTPRLAVDTVRSFLFDGGSPADAEIRRFIVAMRALGPRIGRGGAVAEVHALADFTTTQLLGLLDQLTMRFQSEAAQLAKMHHSRVAQSLEDLDQVNRTTMLISFNAKVEAMRAGMSGRAFAAIADEIQRLAKRTQDAYVQLRRVVGDERR